MELVVRATVIFFFVLLLTRAMGKKELAQLTAFELILLVMIGDLVQQGVTEDDQSLTGAVLAVGTIAALVVLMSYVSWRWPGTRNLIRGTPVVVLRNGRPLDDTMKRERLGVEDLLEGAREQGIADLAQVRLAVLEPDGKLSFIRYGAGDGDGGAGGRNDRPGA